MNTNFSIQKTENRIFCSVPIKTTKIDAFCQSVDVEELANVVSDFVNQQLKDVNKHINNYDTCVFVKNSFDSFISAGAIEMGSALEFSASVKRKDKGVIVQFKDNGKGLDVGSIERKSNMNTTLQFSGSVNLKNNKVTINFPDNVEFMKDENPKFTTLELFHFIKQNNNQIFHNSIRIKLKGDPDEEKKIENEDIEAKTRGDKLIEFNELIVERYKSSQNRNKYFARTEGQGQGLRNAHWNIEMKKGTLQFKNRKKGGCSVVVTFPGV